ncbi:metallophosphoesterase [Gordonia insulae]|uniref:3',5'-cyclic adenosine monophosphate phosphodiesterase CpdA n=1 Tax=Gordonia insulae TaxID=2420509 RepID=A0A3G8JUA3_9ACTN|nr:metallophosphoesterase [Gordonia insulae]AZG47750.1 3',5'-cyclic adenosine monophosphate phosphodiesterase CpdA [Gordonia insulae]
MILFAALFFALITFWLHRRLVHATDLPRPWSVIVDVVLVVLWVLALVGIATGRLLDPAWFRIPAFVGLTWMAAVLYLVLGLVIVAIGSLIARAVARARHTPSDVAMSTRRRSVRVATAAVVVIALATTAYGLVEAARPQVVQAEVDLPDLPAGFDGIRVALISDLHVGPARDERFTRRVVDLVNEQRPDLIVIAGDLTDGTVAQVGPDLAPLADLSAPLGVFGVSGNHEFYADDGGRWLDAWEELGVHTLRNQRVTVEHNGSAIDLAGIQDATAPTPYEPDLPAALADRDPSRFVLLLAHEPRQALEASDLGVDLQLSGHTHGGQMWPIRYLVTLQQPSLQGLDRVGSTVLYTTRGAGAWGPPVRVGAPPEITILELHKPSGR